MPPILKAHIEKKEFHHAYLLCGDAGRCREHAFEISRAILSGSGELTANPDFLHRRFELFGIDDSRELKIRSASRTIGGKAKVFVLEISTFSGESANAMLKLAEEPVPGVHFFVIVPTADTVIPTLRSRFLVIDLPPNLEAELPSEKLAEEFLKNPPVKRVAAAKKIGEKAEPRKEAADMIKGLEIIFEKLIHDSEKRKTAAKALDEIQRSGRFLADRASSPKMILEHLALVLPKI